MPAIISIDYYNNKYKCVKVNVGKSTVTFSTGDVTEDYFEALNYCVIILELSPVVLSSSVDNFVFDNPKYGWEWTPIGQTIVRL